MNTIYSIYRQYVMDYQVEYSNIKRIAHCGVGRRWYTPWLLVARHTHPRLSPVAAREAREAHVLYTTMAATMRAKCGAIRVKVVSERARQR